MITIADQVKIRWFSFVNVGNAHRRSGKGKPCKQPKLDPVSKFLLKFDLYNQDLQPEANNKNKHKC